MHITLRYVKMESAEQMHARQQALLHDAASSHGLHDNQENAQHSRGATYALKDFASLSHRPGRQANSKTQQQPPTRDQVRLRREMRKLKMCLQHVHRQVQEVRHTLKDGAVDGAPLPSEISEPAVPLAKSNAGLASAKENAPLIDALLTVSVLEKSTAPPIDVLGPSPLPAPYQDDMLAQSSAPPIPVPPTEVPRSGLEAELVQPTMALHARDVQLDAALPPPPARTLRLAGSEPFDYDRYLSYVERLAEARVELAALQSLSGGLGPKLRLTCSRLAIPTAYSRGVPFTSAKYHT